MRTREDRLVAHLEAAVSATADGVLLLDRDGRMVSWNKAAERVLSPAGPLAVGAHLASCFVDRALFAELLGRAFDGEIVEARRLDVTGRGGRPGPVGLTLVPVPDDGVSTSPGCTVVLRDRREETSSQEALAEGELKVRRAEALAMTGTFVYDADDQSMQWSEGMYRIHGVDPAGFVPSLVRHLDLVVEENRPRVAELFEQTLAGDATAGTDHRVCRGDGSESWLHLAVEPLTDAAGRVLGLSGVCQDVNARVKVIEEFQRVDALKDEFLATAFHELRTPVDVDRGVHGGPHPGRAGTGQPDRPDRTQRTRHAAARRRTARSGQPRVREGHDRAGPVRAGAGGARPARRAVPHTRDLSVDIPDHLEVTMDLEAFSRVVSNLLGNAVKYAPERRSRSPRLDDPYVAVSVSDLGPGIALDEQEHLFDAFFRAASAARTSSGSGFGLSIVRRYLELHGGDVVCHSHPGHGTTFTFRVPIRPRAGG